jgi:quinol monooxygenase YgiN
MASLIAQVTVHEGTEARFEQAIGELQRRTHAEEPDVIHYEWFRGQEPGSYFTYLSYPDHRTFIEHQVSDQHESAAATFRDMIATIELEWVDPIRESELPATETQPAPDDADELTEKYADRFAATVADWWLPLR